MSRRAYTIVVLPPTKFHLAAIPRRRRHLLLIFSLRHQRPWHWVYLVRRGTALADGRDVPAVRRGRSMSAGRLRQMLSGTSSTAAVRPRGHRPRRFRHRTLLGTGTTRLASATHTNTVNYMYYVYNTLMRFKSRFSAVLLIYCEDRVWNRIGRYQNENLPRPSARQTQPSADENTYSTREYRISLKEVKAGDKKVECPAISAHHVPSVVRLAPQCHSICFPIYFSTRLTVFLGWQKRPL